MELRISGTIKDSVSVNGPGRRFVIMVQGCYGNCKGCFNSQNNDPTQGKSVDIDTLFNEIKEVSSNIDGVTFSGGEPFLQAEVLATLGRKIKEELVLNIITYTGYTFEQILSEIKDSNNLDYLRLVSVSDYIIDGLYEEDNKSDCEFIGSSNQRFIDCKASLDSMSVVEYDIDIISELSKPGASKLVISILENILGIVENIINIIHNFIKNIILIIDSNIESIENPKIKEMCIDVKKSIKIYK